MLLVVRRPAVIDPDNFQARWLRREENSHMANRVTVLVVAGQHSFFGAIENLGLRVLDILNDVSSDYFHLHEVTVRRGIEGKSISQFLEGTIPKVANQGRVVTASPPVRARSSWKPDKVAISLPNLIRAMPPVRCELN